MKEEAENLVKSFLEYYRLSGKRSCPAKVGSCVRMFFTYLDSSGLTFEEVGYKEACAYQLWLKERTKQKGGTYAPGTIANFLKKAVVLYQFLKESGRVVHNPFLELEKLKVGKTLPRSILKEKEMERFLSELARFDKAEGIKQKITAYRVHVVAELLYATGLRISEVASLKEGDLALSRGVIELSAGKGGLKRTVILNEYACAVLKLYVEDLRPLLLREYSSSGLLFGSTGRGLRQTLNKELKVTACALSYPALSAHSFRHALGLHLLRAGADIRYIQALLGHRRLSTTEVYTKVDKEDLKEVLDKYHPRKFGHKEDRDKEARDGE